MRSGAWEGGGGLKDLRKGPGDLGGEVSGICGHEPGVETISDGGDFDGGRARADHRAGPAGAVRVAERDGGNACDSETSS